MFTSLEYILGGMVTRVSATAREQSVPVLKRNGEPVLLPLGPAPAESGGNFSAWPPDNYVTQQMLHAPQGLWKKWMQWVKPVKVPATRFFDTDALGIPEAYALKPGQFVQGAMVVKSPAEARVYIVIVLAPGSTVNEGKWWPKLVQH